MSTTTAVRRRKRHVPAPVRIEEPEPQIELPRRSVSSLTRTRSWSDPVAGCAVSVRVVNGTVVLRIEGRPNPESLRICRWALMGALRVRAVVDVDLTLARVDRRSLDVIAGLVRSAIRAGVVLRLHALPIPALPIPLRRDLAEIVPSTCFELVPGTVRGPVESGVRTDTRDLVADHADGELQGERPPVSEMIAEGRAFLGHGRGWSAYADAVMIECVRRRD